MTAVPPSGPIDLELTPFSTKVRLPLVRFLITKITGPTFRGFSEKKAFMRVEAPPPGEVSGACLIVTLTFRIVRGFVRSAVDSVAPAEAALNAARTHVMASAAERRPIG